jgi:hypothetical protein
VSTTTEHRRRARRGYLALLVFGALMSTLATACTSGRNALGTSNSGCYVALPAATAAVGGQGHLHGARLVSVASLRRTPRLFTMATSRPGLRVAQVCLVAFSGTFRADEVKMPRGRQVGHLAVVVLEYPDNTLLGTIILKTVPLRFGHSHVG